MCYFSSSKVYPSYLPYLPTLPTYLIYGLITYLPTYLPKHLHIYLNKKKTHTHTQSGAEGSQIVTAQKVQTLQDQLDVASLQLKVGR